MVVLRVVPLLAREGGASLAVADGPQGPRAATATRLLVPTIEGP